LQTAGTPLGPNISDRRCGKPALPSQHFQYRIVVELSGLHHLCAECRSRVGARRLFSDPDYRNQRKRLLVDAALGHLNYKIIWQADLTAGILRGHALTRQAKADLVDTRAPRLLRGLPRRFADLDEDGTASGRERFESGCLAYFGYVLQKPGTHGQSSEV
jgi:hypothetical protein